MSKSRHMLVRIVYKKTILISIVVNPTTIDNEWQPVVQWATTSGKTGDNECYNKWQRLVQRMIANESDFRYQNETIM